MIDRQRFSAKALFFVLSLLMCNFSLAQGSYTGRSGEPGEVVENPSAMAMTGDLLVVRPVMFTITILGGAMWLVSLPFSAAGGNVKQAGETLVITPAKHTFYRCLGCSNAGYRDDVESDAN